MNNELQPTTIAEQLPTLTEAQVQEIIDELKFLKAKEVGIEVISNVITLAVIFITLSTSSRGFEEDFSTYDLVLVTILGLMTKTISKSIITGISFADSINRVRTKRLQHQSSTEPDNQPTS